MKNISTIYKGFVCILYQNKLVDRRWFNGNYEREKLVSIWRKRYGKMFSKAEIKDEEE